MTTAITRSNRAQFGLKPGDRIRIVKCCHDTREHTNQLGTVKHLRCSDDAVCEANIDGQDYSCSAAIVELVHTLFENDQVIINWRANAEFHKGEAAHLESKIAARIAELEAALKPKPSLPPIELAWLKHWNAPQYGIDDAMKYGSLSEAYEALKNRVNGRDCTSYGLWCHNQLGTVYTTNPFKSTAFKQQIAMLEKLAPAEVRK